MNKVPHPAEELLVRWFNGELSEAELSRIEQHLNECRDCRTRWEQWRLARVDYMLDRQETQAAIPAPPSGPGVATTLPPTDPFDVIRHWNSLRTQKGWWHSFELPDGTLIEGVCGLDSLRDRIGQFPIPEDLRGKRVLDIGTWDGWFAFEMERRGADVLAIDSWDNPLFHEIHARLQSKVEYRQLDMFKLTPERVGRFDIVLFMGVLYHLKHPLLALERVCSLTTDLAAVDSFILREEHRPGENAGRRALMEFYETNEMGGQTDNWIGPTQQCLMALCRTAGFARVELRNVIEYSACVACYRRWDPPSPAAMPGPKLIDACHNSNHGINFDSSNDDYISVWFDTDIESLTLDDIRTQVGEFGVRPIHTSQLERRRWHANFKLPPGLKPGWHNVTVRIGESLASNGLPIAVDVPVAAGKIQLTGLCDSKTWIKNEIDRAHGRSITFWISGLPRNADRGNLRVYLAGNRLNITFIEKRNDEAPRQVNVDLPKDIKAGLTQIGVSLEDERTEAVDLLIR